LNDDLPSGIPSNPDEESESGIKIANLRDLLRSALERQQLTVIEYDGLKDKNVMLEERIKSLENQVKVIILILNFQI
jgi:hypothetical protein